METFTDFASLPLGILNHTCLIWREIARPCLALFTNDKWAFGDLFPKQLQQINPEAYNMPRVDLDIHNLLLLLLGNGLNIDPI